MVAIDDTKIGTNIPDDISEYPKLTYFVVEGSLVVATIKADCGGCAQAERTRLYPNGQVAVLVPDDHDDPGCFWPKNPNIRPL